MMTTSGSRNLLNNTIKQSSNMYEKVKACRGKRGSGCEVERAGFCILAKTFIRVVVTAFYEIKLMEKLCSAVDAPQRCRSSNFLANVLTKA